MTKNFGFLSQKLEHIVVKQGMAFLRDIESVDHVVQGHPRDRFKPLPNDRFLDWPILKAFADDKINVTQKLKFVLGGVENIVGKGENAGDQHFLLFQQFFFKCLLFQGC